MKIRQLATGFAIAAISSPAAAASADLVFCSKLLDKHERIHCYDAAARIAEARPTVSPRQSTAVPLATVANPPTVNQQAAHSALAKASPVDQPERGRFHGAYAALGASFGSGQPMVTVDPDGTSLIPNGPSAVGAAGYNLQSGNLVVGIEASARYGDESAKFTRNIQTNQDFPGLYSFRTNDTYNWWWKSDGSAHLSARVGMAMANTMIFTQAGLGTAHVKSGANITSTSTFCSGGICTPYGFWIGAQDARWHPSALFGLGIEHNWNRVFARGVGQVEGIFRLGDAKLRGPRGPSCK